MALDKHYAPPGMQAVETVSCDGCFFQGSGNCDEAPECSRDYRPDGCSVIFVQVPSMATAAWPYDSEGTPVEVTQ